MDTSSVGTLESGSAESGGLLGLEITEINPILDSKNVTARTAVEFVLSALGKTTL